MSAGVGVGWGGGRQGRDGAEWALLCTQGPLVCVMGTLDSGVNLCRL